MSEGGAGSVTVWIGDMKAGGHEAAQHLWERYFERLVHLARNKLRSARKAGVAEDEEDAAICAFDSFCRRATDGRFPKLVDRNDLWRLLVVLTVRKALDQLERQRTAKRGGGKLVGEADLEGRGDDNGDNALDRIVSSEPTPELAAMVAEQYRLIRDRLDDDSLRQVFDLRLEGFSREEIAERLGCAVRTVTRKLDLIRQSWPDSENDDDTD